MSDLYGEHRHLTTNARGFRALEEYTKEVPEGRYRVVCAGDSFTLGYGVDDTETYPAWLQRLDPRLQTVNMGQGGYGVDQAYLWYARDGVEIDTDLLLFVFIAPDFERMLDARFNGEYSKPVLVAREGELVVENQPVPNDWTSARGRRRASAFLAQSSLGDLLTRVARRLHGGGARPEPGGPLPYEEAAELMLRNLHRLCAERGQDLALVMIPLRDPSVGRSDEVAAWLGGLSAELDVPYLNLLDDFAVLPKSEVELYYQADGHLNALGNRLVAELLIDDLRERFEEFPR